MNSHAAVALAWRYAADLDLDLLERLWDRAELDPGEADALALEAQHGTRST